MAVAASKPEAVDTHGLAVADVEAEVDGDRGTVKTTVGVDASFLHSIASVGQPLKKLIHQVGFDNQRPINTTQAAEMGWVQSDAPCDPLLGYAYNFGGPLTNATAATIFFTWSDAAAGIPGVISAIQAEYYTFDGIDSVPMGYGEGYFSDPKADSSGQTYRSLPVAFYDGTAVDLCSPPAAPLPPTTTNNAVIAPAGANVRLPPREDSPMLTESWVEGSCIKGMGYHWLKDITSNDAITYEVDNMQPVIAMYHPQTGDLSAIFFLAPRKMQVWDDEYCPLPIPQNLADPKLFECLHKQNFWDAGPGLQQESKNPFYFCQNTCDENCNLQDSIDDRFTTMHWLFYDPAELICPPGLGSNPRIHCRNGFVNDPSNFKAPTASPVSTSGAAILNQSILVLGAGALPLIVSFFTS